MAILYISEFKNLPFTDNGKMQCCDAAEWVVDQTLPFTASSAASSGFNTATRYVLLSSDAVCSISWTLAGASTNAATTSNLRIPASTPIQFGVQAGMKVSAITNT